MTNERQMTGFTVLIAVVLFLAAHSSPGYGNGLLSGDRFRDVCAEKKAELDGVEANLKFLNDNVITVKKELSPEYLISMSDGQLDEKSESALARVKVLREQIERNGASAMELTYLEYYENEIDFWSEVTSVRLLIE